MYTLPPPPQRDWLPEPLHFEIKSKRSGTKTVYKSRYTPRYYGLPEDEGGHLVWLSYCAYENLVIQGDEVEVSFGITGDGRIKECGVHLLYLEDEGQESQYLSTLHHSWDSSMFPYVPYVGANLFCPCAFIRILTVTSNYLEVIHLELLI